MLTVQLLSRRTVLVIIVWPGPGRLNSSMYFAILYYSQLSFVFYDCSVSPDGPAALRLSKRHLLDAPVDLPQMLVRRCCLAAAGDGGHPRPRQLVPHPAGQPRPAVPTTLPASVLASHSDSSRHGDLNSGFIS